ncbi:MAG TPA: transglutaminase domain-containing protein [Tenuifilaceae bacterium]|nr:transglutaminase domain-containing protein [Tenuifilaceae bacterium]
MRINKFLLVSVVPFLMLTSCQNWFNRHLIPGKTQREEVHQRFSERLKLVEAYDTSIQRIVSYDLPLKTREGFEFLYAYMPLSDLAMHSSSYVLEQVQLALEAKDHFKWGRKVPSDIFLHFVLPYRVNNEYTDSARKVFFAELKPRLSGLSAYEAALEVNHWCHEKVTYQPTDERTSGPLTTVRTAFGRCGEESTFTVAAYRSVGIPARQVYTPRWAHTDDNHAWVEVWVDGSWHFLGACEPEPELDMGWFAAPAKRAMMIRTFVFGKYNGQEEKLTESDCFAEINLLPRYAPSKNLSVTVVDEANQPVEAARVEFQIYNYAEFYPIASKVTDKNGLCSITTGLGDMMVYAHRDGKTAFVKVDRSLNEMELKLSSTTSAEATDLLLVPPDEISVTSAADDKVAANSRRLAVEDSLRGCYIATFIDSLSAVKFAASMGINAEKAWHFLSKSRGNWPEIQNFITNMEPGETPVGMALLGILAEKDLHDITAATLRSHLKTVDSFPSLLDSRSFNLFDRYILSPRVGREFITPWREFLQGYFTFDQIGFFRNDPTNLVKWISENIKIDSVENYYKVPISPEGVVRLGIADAYSRDILFVAACRSFGIPARLEPSTKRPQYLMRGSWHDVDFGEREVEASGWGTLTLSATSGMEIASPSYYKHYTIARFENNRFVTLDFENDAQLSTLPFSLSLREGLYRLVCGTRDQNGAVSCRVKYFSIYPDEKTLVTLEFPSSKGKTVVLGNLGDPLIPDIEGSYIKNLGEIGGGGSTVVAIIDPMKEPTRHLVNDLAAIKTQLDKWGGAVVLAIAKDKLPSGFNAQKLLEGVPLPIGVTIGYDSQQSLANALAIACGKPLSTDYPVVAVVNGKGEITFFSEGYSIGLGEKILKEVGE